MSEFCDNTDCENPNPNPKIYLLMLIKDFDNSLCHWCADCIKRDNDMVLYSELELISVKKIAQPYSTTIRKNYINRFDDLNKLRIYLDKLK